MFVRQTKRRVYDKEGKLHKVDILRTFRRNDVPQSIVEDSPVGQTAIAAIQTNPTFTLPNIVNLVMVVGVVLLVIYGVIGCMTVGTSVTSLEDLSYLDNMAPTRKTSLLQLQDELLNQTQWISSLPSSLQSSTKCEILPDRTASCHFTLPLNDHL